MPDVVAETSLLDRFPQYQRGPMGNHFYSVVRRGVTDPGEIIREVRIIACRQLGSLYLTEDKREVVQTLLDALDNDLPAVHRFIAYVLERENMAPEARHALKEERSREYQRNSMASQPPTDAQLKYLTFLGYKGHFPKNRLEASDLIESHKQGAL